jgi:hypothetical protein
MTALKDPFETIVVEGAADAFAELSRRPVAVTQAPPAPIPAAATARFHGFDLQDRPLVAGIAGLPHEIVPARTAVPLLRGHIGSTLVVVFEAGDPRQPIVLGVLHQPAIGPEDEAPAPLVSAKVDDDRFVVTAEREIVLKCGEASITLTRAGKVLITGAYIVSRSTGYNKIKGAAVDIN